MPLKTPAEYVESLRDGRVLYWDGERIDDIATSDRFKVPLAVASRDYEYDDPERRDLMTYKTEDGDLAHRIYQIPRTEDDLLKRLELATSLSIVGGVTGVYMALMSVKDEIAAVNPQYAENIENMWRYARENDLRAAEVITDAKGDRSRKAHEQDDPDLYLRIVSRDSKGIIVRGAKLHITGAALVHELVVMPTKSMREAESDYAVSFSIPANAPGVKIINRSFAPAHLNEFDYPASAHHSMPEGFVIFDDVFVPWERVFLAGEFRMAGVFARSLGLWERTLGMVEAAERAEQLVGLALLVSEQQGKGGTSTVDNAVAEMVCYAQMIRMSLDWACRNFETTPSGMVHPSVLGVNVGKYYFAAGYHQIIQKLHDLAGGLVLTLPTEAELRNPESGKYLRKYLHTTPDVDVEERMRIYNLIRDLTADAYGGWHLVTTLQAGGGLVAQRTMMNRTYDLARARRKAKKAAGITS
jgi:4-hydroxybutyryl-CoA dehydratase/vinylacetyl-CoA-Delta-isomerase